VARLLTRMGPLELHDRLAADTDLAGLRSETAERLAVLQPERILHQAHRQGIRFLVPGDAEWPEGVAELATVEPLHGLTGAPLGLWVRGSLDLASTCRGATAVVGSRSATTYGAEVAGELAAGLAGAGVTVVSGAAFGIDQAAHRGALAARGATVAVLACGVDRAYPAAHRGLLELIGEVGAVVSELPPGCAPTRVRFLSRNRLIAAMATGTVVVEAAVRSGALNTANWAARLGRPVMGVPGPVTSAPSEGVHELIRARDAMLVTRADEVLELVGHMGEFAADPQRPTSCLDGLAANELRVYDAFPARGARTVEQLAVASGLPPTRLLGPLSMLEIAGLVVCQGGRWKRALR